MLFVALFIRRYADHSQMEIHCYAVGQGWRRQEWATPDHPPPDSQTLFVAYTAALGIVLLCPPDLALTLDGRNHPDPKHYQVRGDRGRAQAPSLVTVVVHHGHHHPHRRHRAIITPPP